MLQCPGSIVGGASANKQRCRDMEAHSCGFHVGDVGVGVGVSGRGRRFGRLDVLGVGGLLFVARVLVNEKAL